MPRAEFLATASNRSFEFVRKGHCSSGWIPGFNSFVTKPEDCAAVCGLHPKCRYFAHLEANCSLYMWTETGIHSMSEDPDPNRRNLTNLTWTSQPVAGGTISAKDHSMMMMQWGGVEEMLAKGFVACIDTSTTRARQLAFTNCALYRDQDKCPDHWPITARHKYRDYDVYVLKAEHELKYTFTLQHWMDPNNDFNRAYEFAAEEVHKGHCANGWKQGKNILTNGLGECIMWGYMHISVNFIAHNNKTSVCSLYTGSTCEDDNRYPNFTSHKLKVHDKFPNLTLNEYRQRLLEGNK
jgi:hypothetical protein